jgi:hypothetical protein
MKTIFLTETTGRIDNLNSKIEALVNEGYVVVEFKTSPCPELDKYNSYTIIIVQLNKTN